MNQDQDTSGDVQSAPVTDWPGREIGVRAPMPEETPLSWGEVHAGQRAGVL